MDTFGDVQRTRGGEIAGIVVTGACSLIWWTSFPLSAAYSSRTWEVLHWKNDLPPPTHRRTIFPFNSSVPESNSPFQDIVYINNGRSHRTVQQLPSSHTVFFPLHASASASLSPPCLTSRLSCRPGKPASRASTLRSSTDTRPSSPCATSTSMSPEFHRTPV